MSNIRNLEQIAKDAQERRDQLAREIIIEDECVVFECAGRMFIEKHRIQTPEEYLGWIYWLAAKPWMTPARLKHFMDLATTISGISIKMPIA